MEREFNTAGPCLADRHYMLPVGRRLSQIEDLIAKGAYFVIHAPRQTGKTTLLRNLSRELTAAGTYAAVTVSLEAFTGVDVHRQIPAMVEHLDFVAKQQLPSGLVPPSSAAPEAKPERAFYALIATWAAALDRPLVVFFDEVDALPGPVLVSVLRQLRDGYCGRPAPFAHAAALVGLRDVRDYKVEVRPDGSTLGSSSPFNIKTESLTLRNFNEAEVRELLEQHTQATGQRFADAALREVFHQSQGQPWLCNALAAHLVSRYDALVPDRSQEVGREHVMQAREILIERRDTHLDSLVDKLKEERVRRVLQPILTGDAVFDANFDDDFVYTSNLGLVQRIGGVVRIANPIYQEIIPRVLSFHVQMGIATEPSWYVQKDGTLDLPKLLDSFVTFWQRHGEVLLRGMPYHEAAPHLVLMAYLQRVVNGGGRIEREFAVGTGRVDLCVDFGGQRDIIELKLWRGRHTLPEGLDQVSRYAKRLDRKEGFLVLFDPDGKAYAKGLDWDARGTFETLVHQGVQITLLRA